MNDADPASITPFRWLAVILVPFVIASIYLWLSRWPSRWFSELSDYTALTLAVAAFVAVVLKLPLRREKTILIAVCGVPFLAAALAVFSLVFVGFVFGDWL